MLWSSDWGALPSLGDEEDFPEDLTPKRSGELAEERQEVEGTSRDRTLTCEDLQVRGVRSDGGAKRTSEWMENEVSEEEDSKSGAEEGRGARRGTFQKQTCP